MTLKTVFQIEKMIDSGDMGGVVCEIVLEGKRTRNPAMASLTHLKVSTKTPNYTAIKNYQQKRIKKLRRK